MNNTKWVKCNEIKSIFNASANCVFIFHFKSKQCSSGYRICKKAKLYFFPYSDEYLNFSSVLKNTKKNFRSNINTEKFNINTVNRLMVTCKRNQRYNRNQHENQYANCQEHCLCECVINTTLELPKSWKIALKVHWNFQWKYIFFSSHVRSFWNNSIEQLYFCSFLPQHILLSKFL